MMKKFFITTLFAASTLLTSMAFASNAKDNALAHFEHIGSGNNTATLDSYQDNARLNWVGGPLDGTYQGKDEIQKVWEKFFKASGALKVEVLNTQVAENPKGSTVSADVTFSGEKKIQVRYVITYRDEKIVSETWQVVPL